MVKCLSLAYLDGPQYQIALRGINRDIRAAKQRKMQLGYAASEASDAARRRSKGFLESLQK
jgi:hypothetical protein